MKMGYNLIIVLTVLLTFQTCFAPPVTQNKKENPEQPDSEYGGLEDYMEYHRYLKEVVNALESDPDFRQKLEKANESEIKSGRIAEELQFVSHHVRSRLDEIKRVELQRLKELVEKKQRLEQDSNTIDQDPTHHHLDQDNPHTFEIEDLKKLIAKTTEDLAEADKKRKEEFKRYEMEKEYLKEEKLNHTNGAEKEKLEKEFKEMEEKHKKHERLHQPGHKAQLEEVWEEQDQMQQDFDPKTFFMLHDIDGNGLWDQEEVKALFIKELDKMYQEGAPEDDMRERAEEMERMRESVFREMDTNKDGFIDYREFLQQTNSNDFKQDHGWQGLDEQTRPYTELELEEYIRMQHAGPGNGYPQQRVHPAYQQVPPGAYQQVPPGGYQQVHPNQQYHPGQVPQMPQHDLNTNEIYQQHQPQPPQYQNAHPPQYNPPHNNLPQQYNNPPPNHNNQPQYNNPPPNHNNQQQYQPPPMNTNQQQYQQPPVNTNQQQNIDNQPPNAANSQQQHMPQQNVNHEQQGGGQPPYQQPPVPQQQMNNPQQHQEAQPPQNNVNQGNVPQQQVYQQQNDIHQQRPVGDQPNVQLH